MPASGNFAESLELFFGAATAASCRVYARIARPADCERAELRGTLSGPVCPYAQTLPAEFALVDRGPGLTLLAEAIVPEPCFWTPEMPFLYKAEVELHVDGKLLASTSRTFGIRPLAASGGKLIYAGRTWVLRGVMADEVPPTELTAWHEAETAICLRNPSDAICDEASRVGVLVVAALEQSEVHEIRRLRRWPAVGMIAVSSAGELELRGLSHNAILAQRFAAGEALHWAGWGEAAVCEVRDADAPSDVLADSTMTIVACRPAGSLESVAEGRAACDRLQRDLARHGQFAGYIV